MLATTTLIHHTQEISGLTGKRSTGRLQRLAAAVASAKPFYQELAADSTANQEQLLIKLLQHHSNEPGWIVLVAPKQLPSKALAEYLKLPVDKVLVIHPGAIKNHAETLNKLLHTSSCKVIINFSDLLNQELKGQLSQCAASQQRWFYQLAPQTSMAH